MRTQPFIGADGSATLIHVRLTVALLLASLLAVLWMSGQGPFSSVACCVRPAAVATEPATTTAVAPEAAPGPEQRIGEPNAQVLAGASRLKPWSGPTYPALEHEVQTPMTRREAATPESAIEETALAEEAALPAEPTYTIADPNAEVRANTVNLTQWSGPTYPALEHEVQFPPAPAVTVEVEEPTAEEPAPAEAVVAAAPEYTITDFNAQVRQNAATLPAWKGPDWSIRDHFVYYPPVKAAEAAVAGPLVVTEEVPPVVKLYFATSNWDLPQDADAQLSAIVAYLGAHPASKAVIQGFHDPRGDAESNRMLARNRAGAAWDALVAAGVARDRIVLQQPVNTEGTGNLAEARRAEISIRSE